MNVAAFPNFIRKSDEDGPKYWEVLQTGTFHLKVPDFENRFVILSGKFIEFISQEVREAFILSDQIITRSRKFFSENILFRKFAQHMK